MKKTLAVAAVLLMTIALGWKRLRSPVVESAAQPSPTPVAFRIAFGEQQARERDYSGSVSITGGTIKSVRPWRFFGGDQLRPNGSWNLRVKPGPLENQPNAPFPILRPRVVRNLIPAGVDVEADAGPGARASIEAGGSRWEIPVASLTHREALRFENGDVVVQRTPAVQTISHDPAARHDYGAIAVTRKGVVWIAWQAYRDLGDIVFARHSTASGWSAPVQLSEKADIYRTAIAEDARGRIWAIWCERRAGEWHLYARVFDGGTWSAAQQVTKGNSPNLSHKLISDRSGNSHLIWVGHIDGKSHVLLSRLSGDRWSDPVDISGPSAWVPDAATDSTGNLHVAWDSYRTGNYDIFLRKIDAKGIPGPVQQITKSHGFEAHPSIAVDSRDRVWLAWDASGVNWGKDWSHEDSWRSTVLYADRRIELQVLQGDAWVRPAGDIAAAVPERYNRYWQLPRLACDVTGRIWLAFQVRTTAANNRADYWASGGNWEYFLTTLEGGTWTPAMPVPESGSRPEGPLALATSAGGLWMAWTNHDRPFGLGPAARPARPVGWLVSAGFMPSPAAAPAPDLVALADTPLGEVALVHPNEVEAVRRIRSYRTRAGGVEYRIVRGDFHRHTEISSDGAGDGSVEDYFRYMIDAAEMDTGIIADHNAGNDDEYQWWRTEKAIDLYHIPGRFMPLFGYERSVRYPNGHRNIVFARRGVRTLPISQEEQQVKINTGAVLYPYLRKNRGIAMLHSLATGQGSDYRDNDPELEPLVEVYQGYHASYEYPGAPRAESANFIVPVHAGYRPEGFWWNALAKGLRLGVQASSDHIGVHNSYSLIYTPGVSREQILESMRSRRAYAATDNIIVDFRATDSTGAEHMMGEAFTSATSPRFVFRITGTDKLAVVEIIKNGKFVYRMEPAAATAEFVWTDREATPGESYYYVRVTQEDRNLAWSTPMWVKYP
jgi:hypothetical protein